MQYMSKSVSLNDITSGYRVKIHCFNCGNDYVTKKIPNLKLPRRCKYCGSIKIEPIHVWRA